MSEKRTASPLVANLYYALRSLVPPGARGVNILSPDGTDEGDPRFKTYSTSHNLLKPFIAGSVTLEKPPAQGESSDSETGEIKGSAKINITLPEIDPLEMIFNNPFKVLKLGLAMLGGAAGGYAIGAGGLKKTASRREFLKASAGAGVGAVAAPALLACDTFAPSENPPSSNVRKYISENDPNLVKHALSDYRLHQKLPTNKSEYPHLNELSESLKNAIQPPNASNNVDLKKIRVDYIRTVDGSGFESEMAIAEIGKRTVNNEDGRQYSQSLCLISMINEDGKAQTYQAVYSELPQKIRQSLKIKDHVVAYSLSFADKEFTPTYTPGIISIAHDTKNNVVVTGITNPTTKKALLLAHDAAPGYDAGGGWLEFLGLIPRTAYAESEKTPIPTLTPALPSKIATPTIPIEQLPNRTATAVITATAVATKIPDPTPTPEKINPTPEKTIVDPIRPLILHNVRDTLFSYPIIGTCLDTTIENRIKVSLGIKPKDATKANGIFIGSKGGQEKKPRRLYLSFNNGGWYMSYEYEGKPGVSLGKVTNNATPNAEFSIRINREGTIVTVNDGRTDKVLSLPQSLYTDNTPLGVFGQTQAGADVEIRKLIMSISPEELKEPIPPGLRKFAILKGIHVGAAADTYAFIDDPRYALTLAREYNSYFPVGDFEFSRIRPSKDVFDFSLTDNDVNYAVQNKMEIQGSLLFGAGDVSKPQVENWNNWINPNASRDELIQIMVNHVTKVAERYKGKIKKWKINEYEDKDFQGKPRDFWFNKIGPDYVDIAAEALKKVDPDASIVLNYYANKRGGQGREVEGERVDTTFNVGERLRKKGHKIIMGWEGHMYGNSSSVKVESASIKMALKKVMKRAAEADLQFEITEADDPLDKENSFREMVEAGLEINTEYNKPVFLGITFWGVDASHSWFRKPTFSNMGGYGLNSDPLPIDDQYKRTPGWHAIFNVLTSLN